MPEMKPWKVLNAFELKLFMAFLMVFDHLQGINGLISPELAKVFTIMTRCVAPVFAYLAVEGVIHTRSLKRYNIRLLSAAVIMALGNKVLYYIQTTSSQELAEMKKWQLISSNNIFMTLAMGVLSISLILYARKADGAKKYFAYLLFAGSAGYGFLIEWGTVLIPFMLVVYFLRDKRMARYLGYAGIELFAVISRWEPYYFLAFPFIAMYNGERGPNNKFTKYFFYVFYIAHIWIIAFIDLWVRGVWG